MPTFLSSVIRVTEEPSRIPALASLSSAHLAGLGITERGPVRTPVTITSFTEFVDIYGFATEFALQIRQFFLNGGQQATISRVVHYTDITLPATTTATRGGVTLLTGATAPSAATLLGSAVGPFRVANADTLHMVWDNDGGGGPVADRTAQIVVTAAAVTTVALENYNFPALGAAPYRLAVRINGGPVQNVDLVNADFAAPAAATAEEVAAAINTRLTGASASVIGGNTVRITSDRLGTSSQVDVDAAVGATDANLALSFPLAAANGTGSFTRVGFGVGIGAIADAAAVSVAELEAGFEGVSVDAGVPAQGALVITNDGGRVRISTDAVGGITGTGARLAISSDSVNLATILGLATAAAAGGIDLVAPEAGVVTGASGAAVNTLRIEGKYEGDYSGTLRVEIVNATNTVAADFNLILYRNGLEAERYENLSMDSLSSRYVQTIIGSTGTVRVGESEMVRALDQLAVGTPTQRRPANTALMPTAPLLAAGNDGTAGIVDVDFSGSQAGQTGIRAFDPVANIRLIICPDRATTAVQNALTNYAEVARNLEALVVLDPPVGADVTAIVAHRNGLTATEHGTLYWPRVRIPTPSVDFGADVTVLTNPSGSIAGRMAANDTNMREGPFGQPAGIRNGALVGVVGLETTDVLRESVRDVVFPLRINPIISLPGQAIHADGARTLRLDGNFPSVGERRGVSDIVATLRTGLLFAKNRNNTPDLRQEVDRAIRVYLVSKMRDGAFASQDPAAAFYVDVSDALNPASVIRLGQLRIRIGLATNTPAEFIWIMLTQDTRAIEEELQLP